MRDRWRRSCQPGWEEGKTTRKVSAACQRGRRRHKRDVPFATEVTAHVGVHLTVWFEAREKALRVAQATSGRRVRTPRREVLLSARSLFFFDSILTKQGAFPLSESCTYACEMQVNAKQFGFLGIF